MLLELQKQMLASAYKRNPQLVLNIFEVAIEMNDEDTVRYIAEHYADKFTGDIANDMRTVLAMFEAEDATVQ
jgi:predicted transglutaminase-like protease